MDANTDRCLFSYPHRWPEFTHRLYEGASGLAEFCAIADERDRALEDHLNTRPCGSSGAVISATMLGISAIAGTALEDKAVDNYDEIDYTTGFLDYFSYNLSGGTLIAQKNVWFFVNGYVQWSVADYTDQMELQVYSSTIPGPKFRERGIATTGWDTNDYFQQTSGIMYLASGDSVSLHIRTVNGNNSVGHRQLDVIVLDQTTQRFASG